MNQRVAKVRSWVDIAIKRYEDAVAKLKAERDKRKAANGGAYGSYEDGIITSLRDKVKIYEMKLDRLASTYYHIVAAEEIVERMEDRDKDHDEDEE